MNFLAHFHLSPTTPDALTGAYLGDFVRGPVDDHVDLPLPMRQGITLHRRVDAFTDTHPNWRESAARLAPERRRLAGIIIDIIYDHYLCRHWELYSSTPLNDFADLCYESLLSRTQFMSEEARRGVRRMREQNWLQTYHEVDGIGLAFRRLSRRAPVLIELPLAMEDFRTHYHEMEADFLDYYPNAIAFAASTWKDIQGDAEAR